MSLGPFCIILYVKFIREVIDTMKHYMLVSPRIHLNLSTAPCLSTLPFQTPLSHIADDRSRLRMIGLVLVCRDTTLRAGPPSSHLDKWPGPCWVLRDAGRGKMRRTEGQNSRGEQTPCERNRYKPGIQEEGGRLTLAVNRKVASGERGEDRNPRSYLLWA